MKNESQTRNQFIIGPKSLADLGGGAPGARPPQGSQFFHFDIQNFRNVTASGVHTPSYEVHAPPLREILDPPLKMQKPILHPRGKAKKRIPTCPICGRQFEKGSLKSHVKNHSNMAFRCLEPNCGWMYETFRVLRSHYVNYHGKSITFSEKYWTRPSYNTCRLECPMCKRTVHQRKYQDHVKKS